MKRIRRSKLDGVNLDGVKFVQVARMQRNARVPGMQGPLGTQLERWSGCKSSQCIKLAPECRQLTPSNRHFPGIGRIFAGEKYLLLDSAKATPAMAAAPMAHFMYMSGFRKKVSEGKRRKPTRNHKSFHWCRASPFISDQILRPPHVTGNCHARLSPAHC